MASQFRNSNLGYYLYTAVIILIGAASVFAFWYMITGFNIGKYPENTFIGSVYVGGLTEQEAEEKLRDRVNAWLNDERVVFEVNYQGFVYELDRELLFFDINRSLNNIQAGRSNELFVSFSDQVRAEILFELEQQPFMATLQDQFDLEQLLDDFIEDGARMKTFSSKNLNQYILNVENLYEILVLSSIEVPSNINQANFYSKLTDQYPDGVIPIGARTEFSMLSNFGNAFTNAELSFLGILFLDTISETHMTIFERNYIPQIDGNHTINDFPNFGRNVLVHRSQGLDFSFENNSLSGYNIEFELSGGFLIFRLIGAPFLNEVVVTKAITYVDFPTQTTSNPSLVQDGTQGVIVQVIRHIHNLNGEKIKEVVIITEYYPPVAEIILS
ncbi:hypothetical protein [Liberiplasma polymorphum]|uniref:hypothetical protein n=1 Tax=Liberiplasma polymorphum TaxID=3374570 RepID=UPI0037717363